MTVGGQCHSGNCRGPGGRGFARPSCPLRLVLQGGQPGSGNLVLPGMGGLSRQRKSNERDVDLVFSQGCQSNEHQETNGKRSSKPTNSARWLSFESKDGRTGARESNLCSALCLSPAASCVSQAHWNVSLLSVSGCLGRACHCKCCTFFYPATLNTYLQSDSPHTPHTWAHISSGRISHALLHTLE